MKNFTVESAAITHIGSIKDNNEDNYYINGKYKADYEVDTEAFAEKKAYESYTYAVCDGMGGESYGELASLIAVATLAKFPKEDFRKNINNYLASASEFICDLIRKDEKRRSGTTIAILNIQGKTAVAYNVGDSRVYFCRKGKLYLLSKDHTDPETENKLTRYIGILPGDAGVEPHTSKVIKLKKGDTFLLCSDGLTDGVSNSDIAEIISSTNEAATLMAKQLAAAAQEKGGKDNVTVLVVKVS
ncbi:MAG: serine/threonine-protein phosphatase [Oscillospiraceae bacterium]|nr:serine/threonine-protein phosphatase [Oscillospiraceae bacterium]